MMSVGDDQVLVAHVGMDGSDDQGIGDLPDAVEYAVFVGDLDVGSCRGLDQDVDFAGSAVQHENLAEMSAGGAQKVQAVGLGFGESLLVAEDDVGGIILQAAESDEASPFDAFTGAGDTFRDPEGLGITVDGRFGIMAQDTGLAPVLEG